MKRDGQYSVLFWFTDQQRHDSCGVHGNPLGLTPNFDRLASEGTWLSRHYTPHPVCVPARAALQTGCYGSTTGVYRNGLRMPDDPQRFPTLPRVFGEAGYRTAYFGKWHLDGHDPRAETEAVSRDRRAGWQDWLAANALELVSQPYRCVLYDDEDRERVLPGYRVDAITDRVIDYLGDPPDEPSLLMVSHLEPHEQNDLGRYVAPRGTAEAYRGRWTPPDLNGSLRFINDEGEEVPSNASADLADYWAMCRRLDDALGRVMDALRSTGRDKDTILVVTSDHGCHFRTRNWHNKCSGHEASCRVPGLLWGGPFTGGGRVDRLTSLIDLPPSLAAACGLNAPTSWQGRSVLDLTGHEELASPWRDALLVQVCETEVGRALVTPRWKYGVRGVDVDRKAANARVYREAYLYDLELDPYELDNLAGYKSHAELSRHLAERLAHEMHRVGDPIERVVPAEPRPSGQRAVPIDAWPA